MYRILYVDDDPDLLEVGKLFLEQHGLFTVDIINSLPRHLLSSRLMTMMRLSLIIRCRK